MIALTVARFVPEDGYFYLLTLFSAMPPGGALLTTGGEVVLTSL